MNAGKQGMATFHIEIVKPSHYDKDGYVIQWWKAWVPSNSMAALYGIAQDCAERRVLGDDVAIEVDACDEMNATIPIDRIARRIQAPGHSGLVCLVGVQSNQFPRAMAIARAFRAKGVMVAIGGFHVSGCLAMLKEPTPELKEAMELGIILYAGEAEEHFEAFLRDVHAGAAKPIYNTMDDLPDLQGQTIPYLPRRLVARYDGVLSSFDAGRGCPFQCSFCTIINVQGRKSRFRSADDVEHLVRLNWAQGIHRFFITDDNFSRNEEWEAIFDRLIELREIHGIPLGLMIQVDTLCHRIENFVVKAKRAGVTRVFIGLENINPDNLGAAKKRQNKITEYRSMLLSWKAQGIITLAGYILGFPADTPATIRRDIAIIQKELPLDIIEFFILTPLPGSEDHQALWKSGAVLERDLNIYDAEHVCTTHTQMSAKEWKSIYREAWTLYYTPEHMQTLLRRAAATGVRMTSLVKLLIAFAMMVPLENLHPLQSGLFRLKGRLERRPGLPRESRWIFWPRFAWEVLHNHVVLSWMVIRLTVVAMAIARDPHARAYTDSALTPVSDENDAVLDLMTKTTGAGAAVRHFKKIAELTGANAIN